MPNFPNGETRSDPSCMPPTMACKERLELGAMSDSFLSPLNDQSMTVTVFSRSRTSRTLPPSGISTQKDLHLLLSTLTLRLTVHGTLPTRGAGIGHTSAWRM